MKNNLEKIRNQRKWSQSKLSKISGVARGYISEIESGKYVNIGVKTLSKLCKALNCTIEELVELGEEDNND